MATNLSPEMLQVLADRQKQMASGAGYAFAPIIQDGMVYDPLYSPVNSAGGQSGADALMQSYAKGPQEIWGRREGIQPGEMFDVYDPNGTFNRQAQAGSDDAAANFLIPLMAAGAMYGFLPGLEGFGGAGGASGFGTSSLVEGAGLGSSTMPVNAFTPGIGSSGLGMTSAYGLTPAANLGAMEAAAAAGGAGAAGGAMGASGGGTSAAGAAPAAGGSGGASSLLSGAGSVLGPIATAVGGLLGAKGQENSQTTSRDIPEWLKPYVLGSEGNTGLLGYTQQLLNKQMAPGYMQGYDDMRTRGMEIMNRPMARNPFGG